MMVCFVRRSAALAIVAVITSNPAGAWDNAPWDARPFDQPSQVSARQQALIAAARASMFTKTLSTLQTSTGAITNGRTCSINVGTVNVPTRGNLGSVVNEVTVKGDVINICG